MKIAALRLGRAPISFNEQNLSAHLTLIEELNAAVADGSDERRAEVLDRVTDLFAFGAESFSDEQITLFDDVFKNLVASIEVSARATLAERLANIPNAPPAISRKLAADDEIAVAGPMLEHSEALDRATLMEQARYKGQDHLLAISKRKTLDATIADVLAERGNKPVMLSVVGNPGATFSESGLMMLMRRAEGDDELTTCIGLRRDIPRHHLVRLLVRASHAVRVQLDAAQLMMPSAVQSAVARAARVIQTETGIRSRSYVNACGQIAALKASGLLDSAEVESFAKLGKFEETTAALAALCDLPIEMVEYAMVQDRPETILIIAKAAGMTWPGAKQVLKLRAGERGMGGHELEQCLGTFTRLKAITAQQVVDFQRKRVRGSVSKNL
jgi:uncharacterized protein (DUF2336 family)